MYSNRYFSSRQSDTFSYPDSQNDISLDRIHFLWANLASNHARAGLPWKQSHPCAIVIVPLPEVEIFFYFSRIFWRIVSLRHIIYMTLFCTLFLHEHLDFLTWTAFFSLLKMLILMFILMLVSWCLSLDAYLDHCLMLVLFSLLRSLARPAWQVARSAAVVAAASLGRSCTRWDLTNGRETQWNLSRKDMLLRDA